MKSFWTQGLVRWHQPLHSRMKVLWTLWGTAMGLLGYWMIALATQYPFPRWNHVWLAAAVVVAGICIAYGIKYCEFLEPRLLKAVRFGRPSSASEAPGVRPVATEETIPSGEPEEPRQGA
jgi:hypothetical protein